MDVDKFAQSIITKMDKMERAIRLVLAIDGQKEVIPHPDAAHYLRQKGSWVIRLDPQARKQLKDALKP